MKQSATRMGPLLDRLMGRFGYVPARTFGSELKLEGHLYVSCGGAPEVYLGQNVLTEKMRVNAAGLLARRAADWGFPVTYDGDEGYAATVDPVFPTQLAVGTGTDAALTSNTTMSSPLMKAGSVAYYPLQRILFHRDPALYPPNIPISVSYFFNLPAGESYDGVGTDVDIQEWAMFGPGAPATLPAMTDPPADNDMLTRKLRRFSKLSDVDAVLRWEIRS